MDMALYIKFVSTLAFGLLGLGMVLKVLMDNLFNEWDAVEAAGRFYRDWNKGRLIRHERTEDMLLAAEHGRTSQLTSTRLIDRRREALNQLDEVEHRLHQPATAPAADGPLKVLLAVDAANASAPTDDWGPN